jgi:membrane-bound ClpP family serine protease
LTILKDEGENRKAGLLYCHKYKHILETEEFGSMRDASLTHAFHGRTGREPMELFSFVEGMATLQILIFVAGMLLLLVEAFNPGFGIAGGLGLVLMIVGIILTARNAFEVMVMLGLLLLLVAFLLFLVLRSAKGGMLYRRLILKSSATRQEGFAAVPEDTTLVGKEGVVLTQLRPAGTGEIDGLRMDIVSEGAFIAAGTRIHVVRVEGRRIVVAPVRQTP